VAALSPKPVNVLNEREDPPARFRSSGNGSAAGQRRVFTHACGLDRLHSRGEGDRRGGQLRGVGGLQLPSPNSAFFERIFETGRCNPAGRRSDLVTSNTAGFGDSAIDLTTFVVQEGHDPVRYKALPSSDSIRQESQDLALKSRERGLMEAQIS